jgi:hypothetical protein
LVQIGKTKLVAKANADGFGFELGPRNAIPPALFQAKHLQISVPDKPERSIDLGIGPGRKDLAFLKICAKFWACVAERDSPGNWPGKKKHCYYPRKLPT